MQLDCERARKILWPLDMPCAHGPPETAARDHLARCPRCQGFFRRDESLRRRLRGLEATSVPAPRGLRERISSALASAAAAGQEEASGRARATTPTARRASRFGRARLPWLTGAAAATVLLVGGLLIADRPGAATPPAAFAEDFRRMGPAQTGGPGLDAQDVALFYQREMGRRIMPVALADAGITRATVCVLEGRRGSMIEYDMGGARLAHYRIPESGRPASSGARRIEVSAERGVGVARWHDGQFQNALVAEMPASKLRGIAQARFVSR